MKKFFICLFACLFLLACQTSTETVETLSIDGIQEIQYEELTKNLQSHVKFILYIGRPDCGDCQQFYPTLQDYIDTHEGTGIYYLNIKNFRDRAKADDATQEEKDFYNNLYEELHFSWTPTIHIISNGKFIKTYQYLDEDYYEIKDRNKQIERRNEFIKEFEEFMDSYFKE
jgi:predicted bacteriocin transport accessory protein